MTTPITVTFPKSKASPWLEAEIHERVERLKVLFKDILSCRVVVDIPHRRHQRGNRFSIRIELAVPGEDLALYPPHLAPPELREAFPDAILLGRHEQRLFGVRFVTHTYGFHPSHTG